MPTRESSQRESRRTATLEGNIPVHVHVRHAEAFWRELEAVVTVPSSPTLAQLDNTLGMFVNFCAAYHDKYLPTQLEMQQAMAMLLDSELFTYHDERMVSIMMTDAQENTNPHDLYILYYIIFFYGQRHPRLFRSHRKWKKLLPTLGEVVGVDYDEVFVLGLPPIENRLRLPATYLLYEVCRVQKLTPSELSNFDDQFIDHLFDLVETTRDQQDERLNYAAIKLIAALNEQFMVSTLPSKGAPTGTRQDKMLSPLTAEGEHVRNHHRAKSGQASNYAHDHQEDAKKNNRVLVVLMRRLGSSKTFGENMIFMLNRAKYFFTNDLRVLLDVFIRELVDLPEECEAVSHLVLRLSSQNQLRHTYLRVLYPLLNHTQLKSDTYKRSQIKLVLKSLISNSHIREINPTTTRLVERCLEGSKTLERCQSAENVRMPTRQHPAASSMSLEYVAATLPKKHLGTSIYTYRDPIRQSSLNDLSSSGAQEKDRPLSSASSYSTATEATSRSADNTPPPRRRKPPAPPSKPGLASRKMSTASWTNVDSDGTGTSTSDTPLAISPVSDGEEPVEKSPPLAVKICPASPRPMGWTTFSA
ncbi:hypothetical protein L204_103414 [Cryptococcus depauperatus]